MFGKEREGEGVKTTNANWQGRAHFNVGDRRVASGEGAIHVCRHEGHYRGISRSWKLS